MSHVRITRSMAIVVLLTSALLTAVPELGTQSEANADDLTVSGGRDMDPVTVTSQKGSLLIFPKVEVRWNAAGDVIQDTFLHLSNCSDSIVYFQMYNVQGDPPLPAQGEERAHTGWNCMDAWGELTPNEPTHWSADTGFPLGLLNWSLLDIGDPAGRPDPAVPGERMLRGYVVLWAVNYDGHEIQHNHLSGGATIVNYQDETAWEYGAWSFQCLGVDGTPGQLLLDGVEYEMAPDRLLLDFYAAGASLTSNGRLTTSPDSDLTLLQAGVNLRQESPGPGGTLAQFMFTNENEIMFSGQTQCVTLWDETLFTHFDPPNHFLVAHLQTNRGKARIDGISSGSCEGPNGSEAAPLLGVVAKLLEHEGVSDVAGTTLFSMGTEAATILYLVAKDPQPGRGERTPKRAMPPTPPRSAEDIVSTSRKGSLVVYPNVELKWESDGEEYVLTQDTFLDLSNDYPAGGVNIQLYFVNGDEPLPADGEERAHPGWNWVDCMMTLTQNQPTYWAASTGMPMSCQPFTTLDPGYPPGRPDPENPNGRVLRGCVLAWAVNDQGQEIHWNHLTGNATIANYAGDGSWAYDAYTFRALDQGGEVSHGDQTGTPLVLNLDGVEFACPFDQLLFDFYAVGSTALSSDVSQVVANADLTLLPLMTSLREGSTPITTKATYDIWNMNETQFSGTERCITNWDQVLLSDYSTPNHFQLMNLMTDAGRVRINGISSVVCDDPPEVVSVYAPLLGTKATMLTFDGTSYTAAGRSLLGFGNEATAIEYGEDCNENGIPDAYDIANCDPGDPACQDCNANGIPDECDIADGTSCDFDPNGPNGIPDECEYTILPGDLNCDGAVDFGDINPFVLILTDPDGWRALYPDCPFANGDINGDCEVDFGDINPFVDLLSGG